jgi:hypothetical protein
MFPGRTRLAVVSVGLALALVPATATAGKHAAHVKAKPKPAAKNCPTPKDEPPPIVVTGGKVAVFSFTGDDAETVRRQVMHLLKSKGMKVMTNLRPVDSAEQFREMSVTLNLVAYVDGEVMVEGNDGSATVFVRNGATGMRTASATIAADRHQLAAGIAKEIWDKIGPALSQACADASKPRKGGREPLRINAGTPLTAADTAEATN